MDTACHTPFPCPCSPPRLNTMLTSAAMQPGAGPLSKAATGTPSRLTSAPRSLNVALGARCQPRRATLRVSAEKVPPPAAAAARRPSRLLTPRVRGTHRGVPPCSPVVPLPLPSLPTCSAAQQDDDTGFKTSPLTPAFTRRREHTLGRVAALGFAFSLVRGREECGRGAGAQPPTTAPPGAARPWPAPPAAAAGGRAAGGRGAHHAAAL